MPRRIYFCAARREAERTSVSARRGADARQERIEARDNGRADQMIGEILGRIVGATLQVFVIKP